MGTPAVTPNIDKLAEGIRFDLATVIKQSALLQDCFDAGLIPSNGTLWPWNHLRKTIPDTVTIPQHFVNMAIRPNLWVKFFILGMVWDPDSLAFLIFMTK